MPVILYNNHNNNFLDFQRPQFHSFSRKINFSNDRSCARTHSVPACIHYNDVQQVTTKIIVIICLIYFIIVPIQFHVLVRDLTGRAYRPGALRPATLYRPRCIVSRHVHGAYSNTGPGCGRGSAAVPPTHSLNTFRPSPVHVNPYQYTGTTLSTCAVST